MANFNFAGLDKKFQSASQDYGYLVNAIDIKKAQLEADGKLSPGDYDVLTKMARDAYAHPGLTGQQRSDLQVKMETFSSQKSQTNLSTQNNLGELNGNVDDSMHQISMQFANDPGKYLQAKSTLLAAKIDQLSSSIDSLNTSGDDSTGHSAELSKTMNDYNDTIQALHDVKSYDGKSNPNTDYAAYLITNSKGEVVDMKVDRVGAVSGYNETNGVYGGLPVYGKINSKDSTGNKVFKLGDQTFTAPDLVTPNADGSMKPSTLISTAQQKTSHGFSIAQSGYSNIDPAQVRTQAAIPKDSWARGSGGALYQSNGDGTYKKYVNADQSKLGIQDSDIISLPKSLEQSISSKATQTIDASQPLPAPVPSTLAPTGAPTTAPGTPNPFANIKAPPPAGMDKLPASAIGRPQTGTPTQTAPSTPQASAAQTVSSSGGFLSKVFGGLGLGGK